MTTDYRD